MIDRDHALEQDVLERVSRIAQESGFPAAVTQRLDDVEAAGGPDGGEVLTAAAAFTEARDEYVDAASWTLVGLHRLADELAAGDVAFTAAFEARQLVEEAMAHAAHAAHLVQGAVELVEKSSSEDLL